MENVANIFVKSIFVDNMIFAYFLGMCSYLAVSKNVKTSIGLGVAVVFVLAITLPINYLLEVHVLKEGALAWLSPSLKELDLSYLAFILFIAVIAAMTQLVEMAVEKFSPSLYSSLGIFLPLIAVNCAIMADPAGCPAFRAVRICSTRTALRIGLTEPAISPDPPGGQGQQRSLPAPTLY